MAGFGLLAQASHGPTGENRATRPAPSLQVEACWEGVVATVTVTGELDLTTPPGQTRRRMN